MPCRTAGTRVSDSAACRGALIVVLTALAKIWTALFSLDIEFCGESYGPPAAVSRIVPHSFCVGANEGRRLLLFLFSKPGNRPLVPKKLNMIDRCAILEHRAPGKSMAAHSSAEMPYVRNRFSCLLAAFS